MTITTKHGAKLELQIAVGRSRNTTKWKNQTIAWGELLNRLSATQRTHETVAEYQKMGKDAQDGIKDVGGFVGGFLKEGRRKNGHVKARSIVTLDADFAPVGFWDDVELLASYAMAVYSTHKHTPEKPRLRFLIPLARTVTPEEYEAIARRLAADMGIDFFDDTTYQPARLMYWPSTPKDGEFFFQYIDAPILNPDTVLAKYSDWRDTSSWPESSRCNGVRKKAADKQGDPLAKNGLIGAFCRTYTIQEAISKFLPTVYSECAAPGRYTYNGGSTAAGLVVYDDKFVYSNHATDPISGQLCNAFDLVRVHLFGQLDEDAMASTPVNRLPSWSGMMEMVGKDESVRVQIGTEKLKQAAEDFGEEYAESDKEWLKKLTTTKGGDFEPTITNLKLIIKHDPHLGGIGGRDTFRNHYMVNHKLPWERSGEYWSDLDDAGLREYVENVYGIEAKNKLFDAQMLVFEERAYHPVKDFVESVKWDGVPRVETLLVDYLGADDTEYVRAVTRKTLVAAIARLYNPGCKFDYMLTIVGAQGIGKSLIISKLGGQWYSDTLSDIKGKESYEALDGVWIMEMGELAALKKGEREAIKNYISKQEDTYRKAFNRNVTVNKRQCIFIGTTNDPHFLEDNTGNRRFWVVDTDSGKRKKLVWRDMTQDEIHQIWAEALLAYKKGENIMALSDVEAEQAQNAQEDHLNDDGFTGFVETFLETPITRDWKDKTIYDRQRYYQSTADFKGENGSEAIKRKKVCAAEVWVEGMGKDIAELRKDVSKRINECLDRLGWERRPPTRFEHYGTQRGYARPIDWED